jgi:hypothetical protein
MHNALIDCQRLDCLRHPCKQLAIGCAGYAVSLLLFFLYRRPRLFRLAGGLCGRMQAFEVGQACLITPHSPATVAHQERPCSRFLHW